MQISWHANMHLQDMQCAHTRTCACQCIQISCHANTGTCSLTLYYHRDMLIQWHANPYLYSTDKFISSHISNFSGAPDPRARTLLDIQHRAEICSPVCGSLSVDQWVHWSLHGGQPVLDGKKWNNYFISFISHNILFHPTETSKQGRSYPYRTFSSCFSNSSRAAEGPF